MVVYNYSGKEINAKIVYYGPALSGKTTNLEWIYSKIPLEYSGKMISLRTQTDRTIFFDFLPLELGLIDGFKTRFMLYTVPGQVYYNATRKMVLKGADGVVFVADSEEGRLADNLESFQNLRDNLIEIGIDPDSIPIVLQWNKRDLPATEEVAQLERTLNPEGHPSFGGCALTGEGVYETLHQISRMIYRKLTAEEGASPVQAVDGIDENSLFGDDIAERLQDIDEVDPTLEDSIRLDPAATLATSPKPEGALLDTILGSLGAMGSGPSQPVVEDAPAPSAPVEDLSSAAPSAPLDGSGAPPASVRFDVGEAELEVGVAVESDFTPELPATVAVEPVVAEASAAAPIAESTSSGEMAHASQPQQVMQQTAQGLELPVGAPLSMEESPALALSENGGRPTMADHPMPTSPAPAQPVASADGQPVNPPQAPSAAPAQASASPTPNPQPPAPDPQADAAVADLVDNLFSPMDEEPEPEEDGLAYGSDFGRMVDLGPDPEAGKTPPTEADFELPADLLESGQFTPVIREESKSDGVEPLDLITDPLKSPSEKVSGAVGGAPSGATSTFQPLHAGSRTIEVPVSIDADLLEDGKTLRLVLNLKMRR